VITVTTLTYINSQSVCQLLVKLAELSLQVPITLVLDNARYQRCALVQSLANSLGIELLYLPPYSPKTERGRSFSYLPTGPRSVLRPAFLNISG
jgi:transposase